MLPLLFNLQGVLSEHAINEFKFGYVRFTEFQAAEKLSQAIADYQEFVSPYAAAAQGMGLALARLPVCADDIGAGRVRALDTPIESSTAYWLVTRPGLLRQREGRLVAAWLREQLDGDARPG